MSPRIDNVGFDAMEFNSDSDAAYRALLVYGDDAVERLVKNYYPMLDEALVKDDFLKVKRWLWENWKMRDVGLVPLACKQFRRRVVLRETRRHFRPQKTTQTSPLVTHTVICWCVTGRPVW